MMKSTIILALAVFAAACGGQGTANHADHSNHSNTADKSATNSNTNAVNAPAANANGEKPKRTAKPPEEVEFPKGATRVIVSRKGFDPKEITLKKGEAIKLAFYRIDEENCADEVVFKDTDVRKKLPLGEVVVVDLPASDKSEITFACGMDMYRGKLILN